MAGVKRVEGEEGARRPPAEQHGYQFAEARRPSGLALRDVAAWVWE
ncbi:hypothetical protein [Streptomyces coelicoflavus]